MKSFLQTTGQGSCFLMGVSAICVVVMLRRPVAIVWDPNRFSVNFCIMLCEWCAYGVNKLVSGVKQFNEWYEPSDFGCYLYCFGVNLTSSVMWNMLLWCEYTNMVWNKCVWNIDCGVKHTSWCETESKIQYLLRWSVFGLWSIYFAVT